MDYRLSASRGVRPQVSLRASRQRPFLDGTLGLLKAPARPGLSFVVLGWTQTYRRLRRTASTRCLILSAVRRFAVRSKWSAMTRNSVAISINAIFA